MSNDAQLKIFLRYMAAYNGFTLWLQRLGVDDLQLSD